MPNADNIRKVIAMIEKEQNHFDMMHWHKDYSKSIQCNENVCGTPSCIGGWAEAIMMREMGFDKDAELGNLSEREIGDWLGLNNYESFALFYPSLGEERQEDGSNAGYRATRYQAIAHLEHIIETGKVDWAKFV